MTQDRVVVYMLYNPSYSYIEAKKKLEEEDKKDFKNIFKL